ncbi:ribosome assembly RNA-binding protein YhbY [Deltaproteobacteria bacterium TL4]
MKGKQKRYLKGLAHSMNPLVRIGKQGLSEAVCKQIQQCLLEHELIKIKVLESSPLDRKECAKAISERIEAEVVQVIGHVIVLYQAHPEEPTLVLPE